MSSDINLHIIDDKEALVKLIPIIKECKKLGLYYTIKDGVLTVDGHIEMTGI